MTQQKTTTGQKSHGGQTGLLAEWHGQSRIKRLLLPSDLVDEAKPIADESLVCRKTTTEYLNMTDKWESVALKVKDVDRYSTDFDYRPDKFKNETRTLMAGAQGVQCSRCSGSGQTECSPTMNCRGCGGSGLGDVPCRQCGGSGRENYVQSTQTRFGVQTETRTRFCRRCGNRGTETGTCPRCGGGKKETCDKCRGSGVVACTVCDGVGTLVSARICTRKFTCSTEFEYQLSGLSANEFKNGLAANNFKKIAGNQLSQEFQSPDDEDTVLQRESVESYDVLTSEYDYRGKIFWVNQIRSDASLKWVTPGVPFSLPRVGITAGIALIVVAALITLPIVL